jgi:hypothetical protein
MRTSTAFFAGAGTVVAAIAAGLGGGLLIADMVSPHSSRQEMTRLERRMSPEPIPVSNAPSEPVPYLAGAQAAITNPNAAAAPARDQQPAALTDASAANARPATSAPQPPVPATQATAPDQNKASEQIKARDDAFAEPGDADVRHEADARREAKRAEERRRAERRQQWADKRRYQQRQDQELREVEQKVREVTEPRRIFAAEPVRIETPRIKLFGEDD